MKPFLRGLVFLVLAAVLFVLQIVIFQEFLGWGWQLIALVIANEFAAFLIIALIVDNRTAIGNWLFVFVSSNATMRVLMTLVFYFAVSFIAWFAPNLDSVYGSMMVVVSSAVLGLIVSWYVVKHSQIFTSNGKLAFVLALIILMIAGITESIVYTWQQWIMVLVVLFAIMLVIVKIVPVVVNLLNGAGTTSFVRAIVLLIAITIGGGFIVQIVSYFYVWFAQGVVDKYIQYVTTTTWRPYMVVGALIILAFVAYSAYGKSKLKGLAALAIAIGAAIIFQPYTLETAQTIAGVTLNVIPNMFVVPLGILAFALAGFFLLWDKVK